VGTGDSDQQFFEQSESRNDTEWYNNNNNNNNSAADTTNNYRTGVDGIIHINDSLDDDRNDADHRFPNPREHEKKIERSSNDHVFVIDTPENIITENFADRYDSFDATEEHRETDPEQPGLFPKIDRASDPGFAMDGAEKIPGDTPNDQYYSFDENEESFDANEEYYDTDRQERHLFRIPDRENEQAFGTNRAENTASEAVADRYHSLDAKQHLEDEFGSQPRDPALFHDATRRTKNKGEAYDRYVSLASQQEEEEERERYIALAKQTREEEFLIYQRGEIDDDRYVCLA